MVGARLGESFECFGRGQNTLIDSPFKVHRIHTCGDPFQAFLQNRLGQNRGRCGAITRHIGGLRCDLFHHLGTHVFSFILQLDLFCDRNAVLGHRRRTEGFIQYHISALGAEGYFNGVRQHVYAAELGVAGMFAKFHFFSSHCLFIL